MKRTFSDANQEEDKIDVTSNSFSLKRDYIFVPETEEIHVGLHHGGSFEVYMSHKVTKLRNVHRGDDMEKISSIFTSCVLYVNGVTNPPVEEIRRVVTIYGGECVNYRVSEVTHFVCDYFTDAQLKVELARQRSLANRIPICNVTSAWIMESIKAGKRLPERDFLPNGLKMKSGANVLQMLKQSALNAESIGAKQMNSLCSEQSNSVSTVCIENLLNGERMESVKKEFDLINISDSPLSSSNCLTLTQRGFISSLPLELRKDALNQLREEAQLTAETEGINFQGNVDLVTGLEEQDENFRSDLETKEFHENSLQELVTKVFGWKLNKFSPCSNRRLRQEIQSILLQFQHLAELKERNSEYIVYRARTFRQILFLFGVWMIERDLLEQTQLLIAIIFNAFQENNVFSCNEALLLLKTEAKLLVSDLQAYCLKRFGCNLSVSSC